MAIIYKPGVYTWVHLIKKICRFITKHQGTFMPVLESSMTLTQFGTMTTAVAAINAACAVLDVIYPNVKA